MILDNVYIKKIVFTEPPIHVPNSVLENKIINTLKDVIPSNPLKNDIPLGIIKTLPGLIKRYTGIKSRYYWEDPDPIKICRDIMKEFHIDDKIRTVIYSSLTKPFIEPSVALKLMQGFNFNKKAIGYNLDSACLSMVLGIINVAKDVTLQKSSGIIISYEDSKKLFEGTLAALKNHYKTNNDKKYFKKNVATLTLGSGAMGILVGPDSGMCKIHGYYQMSDPSCADYSIGKFENNNLVMYTVYGKLMEEGSKIISDAIGEAMDHFKWNNVDSAFTHQVGYHHDSFARKCLKRYAKLVDYVTYPEYGNIGPISMPLTLLKAYEDKKIKKGDKVLAVGFGSGIVVGILGLEF